MITSYPFQVISPVNCARRGWINIEPDVITCEACEARLLFSTPSSWAPQQGLCIVVLDSCSISTTVKKPINRHTLIFGFYMKKVTIMF